MANENLKGITVKVDADLHAEVKQYIESQGITMAEFVAKALDDELHPKFKNEEVQTDVRTIAFQVSEELYQKIKDYLKKNNLTQKDFMRELVERAIEQDQAVSEVNTKNEELAEEQEEIPADEEFGDVTDESEELNDSDEELNEDEETETMGMSMGM